MAKSESRLELEGEAEVPEIITMSDAVESTKVDLDGKSHREHAEERFSRKRSADSSGIIGNAGVCMRSKVCETGRSGRDEFRTKCGQCSAVSYVPLRQAVLREVTQLLAVGVCGDL